MHWTESGLCTRDGVIQLTHKWVSFTQQISSLVLICDAKTWSYKKKKRKKRRSECIDCFGHWTVFMHWTESGLCTRDGWIRTDPQRGQFLPTNLFPGLVCDAKTWSHKKKKRKRICSECVYCFGHGTVFMHQTESGLCTRGGWLRADPQRS